MAPQIRAVSKTFVIDFDDPVGAKVREPLARLDVFEFKQAGMIAIDPELGRASQHAFALDAFYYDAADCTLADRSAGSYPGREQTRTNVGSAANNNGMFTITYVDDNAFVFAFWEWLDADDTRGNYTREVRTDGLDGFTLGRFHGDEVFQLPRVGGQTRYELTQPEIGKLQLNILCETESELR
jgi:hypothetical protein